MTPEEEELERPLVFPPGTNVAGTIALVRQRVELEKRVMGANADPYHYEGVLEGVGRVESALMKTGYISGAVKGGAK